MAAGPRTTPTPSWPQRCGHWPADQLAGAEPTSQRESTPTSRRLASPPPMKMCRARVAPVEGPVPADLLFAPNQVNLSSTSLRLTRPTAPGCGGPRPGCSACAHRGAVSPLGVVEDPHVCGDTSAQPGGGPVGELKRPDTAAVSPSTGTDGDQSATTSRDRQLSLSFTKNLVKHDDDADNLVALATVPRSTRSGGRRPRHSACFGPGDESEVRNVLDRGLLVANGRRSRRWCG